MKPGETQLFLAKCPGKLFQFVYDTDLFFFIQNDNGTPNNAKDDDNKGNLQFSAQIKMIIAEIFIRNSENFTIQNIRKIQYLRGKCLHYRGSWLV